MRTLQIADDGQYLFIEVRKDDSTEPMYLYIPYQTDNDGNILPEWHECLTIDEVEMKKMHKEKVNRIKKLFD